MAIPITIKGKVKIRIRKKDNFAIDSFLTHMSEALKAEDATINKAENNLIRFIGPGQFRRGEFGRRPLDNVANGTIKLEFISDYILVSYTTNHLEICLIYTMMFFLFGSICILVANRKLFASLFFAGVWVAVILKTIIESNLLFRNFIKESIKNAEAKIKDQACS